MTHNARPFARPGVTSSLEGRLPNTFAYLETAVTQTSMLVESHDQTRCTRANLRLEAQCRRTLLDDFEHSRRAGDGNAIDEIVFSVATDLGARRAY